MAQPGPGSSMTGVQRTKRPRGRPANPRSSTKHPNSHKRQRRAGGTTAAAAAQAQVVEQEQQARAEEDQKRNKFLERNRVAASKCRQKKKEWTSNLESRARTLQNERNQLSLMASSLKEEVLWLKGELLKHSTCDCERIRHYLNREANHLAPGPIPRRVALPGLSQAMSSPSLSSSGQSSAGLPEEDEGFVGGRESNGDSADGSRRASLGAATALSVSGKSESLAVGSKAAGEKRRRPSSGGRERGMEVDQGQDDGVDADDDVDGA